MSITAVAVLPASSVRPEAAPPDFVVDLQARTVNPQHGGVLYGNSFLRELKMSAAEAHHQANLSAQDIEDGI